jgi:flavin-dependent dehydrogenase
VIHDALIVGGGPAGATAAVLLAKAGWSVAIVEQTPFPRRKVCGEFISSTNQPLLRELGVADAFGGLAGPLVRSVGLFAGAAVLTAPMPHPRIPVEPWGRALGRESLDQLMLDAAVRAGARLWQPWRAVRLHRHNGLIVCMIATTERATKDLRARTLIAAQGSWQRDKILDTSVKAHEPSDLLAFKAHFTDYDLPQDLMALLVFPGGYGGLVHTDRGRVSFSCCIRRDELWKCRQRWRGARAGDIVLAHVRASCVGAREALRQASLDGAWMSAGPIRPGIRKCYSDGIFLAGNVAAEAHPIIAEGISMAMQSSWLLARHLIVRQGDAGREHFMKRLAGRTNRNGGHGSRRASMLPRFLPALPCGRIS